MSQPLIAFLGPSLAAAQARRSFRCKVFPPARQGDVWRALALRPRAIALIDGVFESEPSVWHHELLAAIDAGVAVFGAASMGALRAAELERFGMVGVGQIFRWVRDGVVRDDSEVALLHAGAEHGYRAFTLPLVNVRHAARLARGAGVLNGSEARALVSVASRIFYQERRWKNVLAAASERWRPGAQARWRAWADAGIEDLKERDARQCLQLAARFVAAAPPRPSASPQGPSSLVRRRRLFEGASQAPNGRLVPSRTVLERLARHPGAERLAQSGLRRLLLAGWARSLGLEVGPDRLERARSGWLHRLGVRPAQRVAFQKASGLDDSQAKRLVEDLALEAWVLEEAARMLPDGPSWPEALASESQVRGLWATQVKAIARRARRPRRRETAVRPR